MPASDSFQGVSNCYVFKSRLQEYAQKVGLPTPVYETIKEGLPHEPTFRSTVVVNDKRYDSLPGFYNRKAAEQSAAEVALLELSRVGDMKECISQPVHETGLCKNLLQEYAQKMNYAVPLYECTTVKGMGNHAFYTCTVDIGGVKYIGGHSKTKKGAELKAARTALLAIESDSSKSNNNNNVPTTDHPAYTVVPLKKKVTDPMGISHQETAASLKPKKRGRKKASGRGGRFKRRKSDKRNDKSDLLSNIKTSDDIGANKVGSESGATILQVTGNLGGGGSILGLEHVNPVMVCPTLCEREPQNDGGTSTSLWMYDQD
ncbi:unnamed protein product [Cuscuta epithymum]|uniref:DRBM domain-containing protein n=1 Tax=Cuscuta epithymum TaxID=186058 RepID=A0AAV0C3R1_9ASTE|nr:unnamed protein product [Cuscuta epithymum]